MSAEWQPEMDHLRRRVEELEKMLCRPEPVTLAAECCTDGTCPTCAPLMAWADYRKDYQPRDTVTASKAFRAGWEASREYHRDTPDPEPDTGEIVTLCHHGLDAADCPEHGHTLDDHCPVCFGSCGGFPVPEIECCGRGPACGACDDPEPPGCPARPGWEASREYHRDTPDPTSDMLYDAWCIIANAPVRGWAFSGIPEPEAKEWIDAAKRWRDAFHDLNSAPEPDPDPEPEWREWVTAQHDEVVGSRASALEDVLMCLSEVERGTDPRAALARIVARCEREIGGRWQADPDAAPYPRRNTVQWLMWPLAVGGSEGMWAGCAARAASWLRDITRDSAATPGCPACDGVAGTTCRCPEPDPVPETECGAECGNSVHMHRCGTRSDHTRHACFDCGYSWLRDITHAAPTAAQGGLLVGEDDQ